MKLGEVVRLRKFTDWPDNEIIERIDHDLKGGKVAVCIFMGYEDLDYDGERLELRDALDDLVAQADWDANARHIMAIPMKEPKP